MSTKLIRPRVARRHRVVPARIAPETAWDEATQLLVGGVNSPVRAFRHVGGVPIMLSRAEGARAFDTQGRALVDLVMGWGALILGHQHPAVATAARQALAAGDCFGFTHPAEVELAGLITASVPSIEQVRFTASGTEACMTAVRLARAVTGRSKILMFDGCYHGHGESLIARMSPGSSEATTAETVLIPFNDPAAFERAMDRYGKELACVILEPIAANTGVIVPERTRLARIREMTNRHGTLLIFDEVVTGFRIGLDGAQGMFGVVPDLTTLGKIIGGGMPIGALGGPRQLMRQLAPEGDVYHGGTFAGHPLSMAAGVATLRTLRADPPYGRLEQLAGDLAEGFEQAAAEANVPIQINGVGSMLSVFFTREPVERAVQVRESRRDRFAAWAKGMLRRDILLPPSPYETIFLSTAHTARDVEHIVRAAMEAFWASNAE